MTCNQSDLVAAQIRLPASGRIADTPFPLVDGMITLSTDNADAYCVDGVSGDVVACDQAAVPGPGFGNVRIPARTEPRLGMIAVQPDDIRRMAPTITDAALSVICSSRPVVGGSSWRATCDEADLRFHYEKVPTTAIVNNVVLPYASAGRPNYDGTVDVSTNALGVTCIDTDTGKTSTRVGACDFLPNPPSARTLTIPATFSPSFRTYVVDKAAILAAAPTITSFDGVCRKDGYVSVTGGQSEWWAGRCDTAAIAERYVRVVTAMKNSDTVARPSTTPAQVANYTGTITLSPQTVVCRDTTTGAAATDTTRCNTLAQPGPVTLNATYSPLLQRFAINPDDLVAKYPEAASPCAYSGYVVPANGGQQLWEIRCTEESVRLHYKIVASKAQANDYAIGTPLDGRANFTGTMGFNTSVDPLCIDTDNNTSLGTVSAVRGCKFQPLPSNVAANTGVPGKFSPTYRRVYINPADVAAIAPTAPQSGYCASYFIAGEYRQWRTTCNEADIRVHHRKVAYNVYVSYASGAALAAGPVGFTIETPGNSPYACIDTDTGRQVALTQDNTCGFLPDPAVPTTRIPVTRSDKTARTLWVSRAAVLAIMPDVNINGVCSSRTIDNSAYVYWDVRCDP